MSSWQTVWTIVEDMCGSLQRYKVSLEELKHDVRRACAARGIQVPQEQEQRETTKRVPLKVEVGADLFGELLDALKYAGVPEDSCRRLLDGHPQEDHFCSYLHGPDMRPTIVCVRKVWQQWELHMLRLHSPLSSVDDAKTCQMAFVILLTEFWSIPEIAQQRRTYEKNWRKIRLGSPDVKFDLRTSDFIEHRSEDPLKYLPVSQTKH
jgi:hypothetical protein